MADKPGWDSCPTCHRVLYVGDVCDTPACVKVAEKAAANPPPDPNVPPAGV